MQLAAATVLCRSAPCRQRRTEARRVACTVTTAKSGGSEMECTTRRSLVCLALFQAMVACFAEIYIYHLLCFYLFTSENFTGFLIYIMYNCSASVALGYSSPAQHKQPQHRLLRSHLLCRLVCTKKWRVRTPRRHMPTTRWLRRRWQTLLKSRRMHLGQLWIEAE